MKTFAAVAAAVAVAVQVPTAQAWWDNGHMLVGEVARQLMDKADVDVLNKLLSNWTEAFPNTDSLATAAIWPDLIKCSNGGTTTCKSLLQPSFSSMGDWHYVDLPIDVAGGKWGDMNPDDLNLFTYSLGGNAIDVLEKSVATIKTTKSAWSANLVIRNFIHIFGDLHQPLHAVAGVRSDLANGNDGGGNSFKFASPCAFSNLHALWDAAGGVYSQNNWSPLTKDTDVYFPTLVSNASALIKLLPIITDSLNIDSLKSLSYDAFATKVTTNADYTFRKVALDSYGLANQVVYKGLDLKFTGTTVPCPAQSYMDWAGQIAQFRIALGGKRLAVFLTQFARKISANNFL